ncbi:meiotic nuclear division protein Mnd1 [Hamiltosporidium tvaerminnensis]|uniref:Meiotic nuclear division protein 1 n=1 Tax=Hamiltosporidium tvaerminnensis TaxID=1176355 RepID=A0A4Q9KYA6_9MICR|nr:meiotic nuclear division protein Mnd1 [Hamiltosporidium tvaerminnensis]TBU10325.1 meiotic nuclear division protein Mnd1 [Hamiltosporidium tvaerminnensis]TBU12991.1 meiotic nuclear division protein Mnd1 [Hamiltosporidium tvaerminnensis]
MNKRTTQEEKRQKVLDFFKEKKEFFTLKELEKLLPKAKGVVSQKVKEIIQSLVDDDLIKQEKIGISHYFWCFPSDTLHTLELSLSKCENENKKMKEEISQKEKELKKMCKLRQESDIRSDMIVQWNSLKDTVLQQNKEINMFSECDPDLYNKNLNEISLMKESINKITDNIFTLQSYVSDKFNVERVDFNNNFSVDDDMDYV